MTRPKAVIMDRMAAHKRFAHGVLVILAMLALSVRLAIPAGVMVAPTRTGVGLLICTGHGPLVITDPHDRRPQPRRSADAPCAFAGTPVGAPPETPAPSARPLALTPRRPEPRPIADQAPGRGLAAPPPQSHAPPRSPEPT
jgi:hypothetical protein